MAKPDRGNINRMLYTAEDAAGLLGVDAPWLRRKATTTGGNPLHLSRHAPPVLRY